MSFDIDEILRSGASPLRPNPAFEKRLALKIHQLTEQQALVEEVEVVELPRAAEQAKTSRKPSGLVVLGLVAAVTIVIGLAVRPPSDEAPITTDRSSTTAPSTTNTPPTTAAKTDAGQAFTVVEGESIQAALDLAQPGDTVIVEAGEYTERIMIRKDGITLEGRNAILLPPAFPDGDCTSTGAKIAHQISIAKPCGSAVKAPGTYNDWPDEVIADVVVRGFKVTGGNEGVGVLLGAGVTISDMEISDTSGTGFFVIDSTNIALENNTLTNVGVASGLGIWIAGDSENIRLTDNSVDTVRKGPGIAATLVRDVEISNNTVVGACGSGVVIINSFEVSVESNQIGDNTKVCTQAGERLTGISILGTEGASVASNTVTGQSHNERSAIGIWIGDTPGDPNFEARATGSVTVSDNDLSGNDTDIDLNNAETVNGSGNRCQVPSIVHTLCE